ncbi:MAG: FMN-binding glutamate synthase family protein [Gammaproteobacteria bacterium]|nr:FMN-binding glutamate synthase family protein [Gammaproteobacteria bacterium]MBT8151677.1 FMN-binding glutamate synthase family protein [Gammaproteobacteria bacterium]NND40166.1 FMN-binding glutamate synthase family protein [Pseudomonadales bacterium]NNL10722.1 FMN-binding glutamate synthase family protein [Pseudomonadales bacterium]NNM12623.1 FMN-binding glutamate synthase family protein [Pseudomonadales bacterium]
MQSTAQSFDLNTLQNIATGVLQVSALVFLLLFVIGVLVVLYLYLSDVTQTKQAIRRNYPVIGRFRYLFEHLGEFFRQYFFSMDREELPFNRAQRAWVYRAAKNIDSTVAFGSTNPMNRAGDVIFVNDMFPVLSENFAEPRPVIIGEGYCEMPYKTRSIFNVSGMSFGAISIPAVKALSHGAKKAGIWLNTGEGGLSPYHLEGGCDLVFQIGTAKYGVRDSKGKLSDEKLLELATKKEVRMFEIKLSQGAKPGKGGILPGVKVTPVIASTRGIPEGSDSISPNGHPDIRSVDELLEMIYRIRNVTGKPCGFKAVVGKSEWLDEMMQAIHRRGLDHAPDFITIDSADGGTGAAPQSLIDFMGLPLRRSLPLVVDKLVEYGLRERIKVICAGKLVNPSHVAWALCMGADFITSARGFMFSLGCIQAMQCNKNTCPTGITTHDPELQRGLDPADKTERVANYAKNIVYEVGTIAHSCGVAEPRELTRGHAQIINDAGMPVPMADIHPNAETRQEYLKHYARGEAAMQVDK